MIACGGAQYAQKVLRYGKLGDVVGGQEKAGEGDEHGAVYEDRPVLRKKRVPDVHQRIPQQGSCTGLPLRANSSPCSSTENSDSAQNAVSNAMTTRHRMMAGETKMSEALLLFR